MNDKNEKCYGAKMCQLTAEILGKTLIEKHIQPDYSVTTSTGNATSWDICDNQSLIIYKTPSSKEFEYLIWYRIKSTEALIDFTNEED